VALADAFACYAELLSIRRRCELGLNRSSLYDYDDPLGETPENLRRMRMIDESHTACPFFDGWRMTVGLSGHGEEVARK
jgi:hypothetical protein